MTRRAENITERVLEKTYNRMWTSLHGAIVQCRREELPAVLKTGMRVYLPRITHRQITDQEIETYISKRLAENRRPANSPGGAA